AGTRLLRRPRHTVAADLHHTFAQRLTLGAGATWIVDREDVHAATFATIDAEDYLLLRAYASWRATDRLALRLRVENALDEHYEAVHGYPTPGLAVYGGIDWQF